MSRPLDGGTLDGHQVLIDQPSPIRGYTYRQLVKDLDEGPKELQGFELKFVADAIDHPERFVTPKQLATIVSIWERHYS